MRTTTRWLTVGTSALVLVGGALTVAAATEGSREVPGGPGWEQRYGEMRGDVDRIEDRDRLRLHDGSCLDEAVAADATSPAGEAVQERTRGRAGEHGCACEPAGEAHGYAEQNRHDGVGGPQREQERNGSGPNGSEPVSERQQTQTQTQEQVQEQFQEQEQTQTQTQEQGGNTTGTSGSAGRGGA